MSYKLYKRNGTSRHYYDYILVQDDVHCVVGDSIPEFLSPSEEQYAFQKSSETLKNYKLVKEFKDESELIELYPEEFI